MRGSLAVRYNTLIYQSTQTERHRAYNGCSRKTDGGTILRDGRKLGFVSAHLGLVLFKLVGVIVLRVWWRQESLLLLL